MKRSREQEMATDSKRCLKKKEKYEQVYNTTATGSMKTKSILRTDVRAENTSLLLLGDGLRPQTVFAINDICLDLHLVKK